MNGGPDEVAHREVAEADFYVTANPGEDEVVSVRKEFR